MTKLLSRSMIVFVVLALAGGTAEAQITDVFESAFKSVAGFNVWSAWPIYTSSDNIAEHRSDFTRMSQKVLAYSVKFAPLNFGGQFHDLPNDKTVVINTIYNRIGGTDFYNVQFDTVVAGITKTYQTVVSFEHGVVVPPNSTATNIEEAWVPAHHISLNLGYAAAPNFDYQNGGLTSSFPINGTFLETITQLLPWEGPSANALSLVIGLSIPSLSNIPAKFVGSNGDTTLLKVSSPIAVSPDIGLGFSHKFGEGFFLFLDVGYKFQSFRGLDYAPTLSSDSLTKDILDRLPKEINTDNWRIKLGFSFNIAN